MRNTSLIVALVCASPLFAGRMYWYNGDSDGDTNLINQVDGFFGTALVCDDFVVGAGGVNITGVFSNDIVQNINSALNDPGVVTEADWQILSGVSAGNGGTVVASGSGAAATQTDTGLTSDKLEVYDIAIGGLNVTLTPGTYWLAVAPDLTSNDDAFVETTAGLNGVGTPQAQDGDSFFNSSVFSANFASAFIYTGADSNDRGNVDFSMGVISTPAGSVSDTQSSPEPGTAALSAGAILLLGLAAVARRSWNYDS